MMIPIQKIGTYMFMLGVLICIFSGGFSVSSGLESIVLILVILTGAFVGLLNIEEDRQFHFLVAGGVFIIASSALQHYLANLLILSNFQDIFVNLTIFTASACIVVGLKLVFQYASVNPYHKRDDEPVEFKDPKKQELWDGVIFISVCLAFVIFILEAFFYTNGLTPFLEALSYAIIAIFFIDAIILYARSDNFWSFLRHHWADVVSVIPFSGIFQVAKAVRIVRISRTFSHTSKLARMSKISHSSKFFSKHSGFNKYHKHAK